MKAIKIIFGVVTLFVILFLSTGLFVKETTYEVGVEIEKPLAEVFDVFSNQNVLKDWWPGIQSISPISEKPGIVGSEYEIVVHANDQASTIIKKILSYVPNQKLTYHMQAHNILKTDNYTFTEKNGTTFMLKEVSCKSEYHIINCMFPYLKSVFRDMDEEQMNSFKAYIES